MKWQNGADFTADDVVATMERIVAKGDGLGGSIKTGDVTASDPTTVVFKLASPNASLPYLVSIYNPQSAITPKDYAAGTTLDAQPDGTGPWKLTKYDPTTGATFERNDAWWGGKTPLDSIDWQFFTDVSSMVTAMQSGSVDAIVQFSVVGGDALLNDANFNTIKMRTSTHRQIWMNCKKGQFTDKRVRQAFALSLDRQALIDTLFKGNGRHRQRQRDRAALPVLRQVRAAAHPRHRQGQAAPRRCRLPERHQGHVARRRPARDAAARRVGPDPGCRGRFHARSQRRVRLPPSTRRSGAPASPCAGSAELGIVDYGHRATPDVFLLKAFKTGGDWNSSEYSSPDLDAAILEYQASADLDKRTAACKKIETIMLEDTPAAIPYFYNYLGGFSKSFTGVRLSALGQMLLDKAAKA